MRVAVFGGSFDPPHVGHDMVVQEALRVLQVDTFFIVPTWLNPFKKRFFASPKKRLEWAKKLWGDLEKVKICDFELQNKRSTNTIETIKFLHETYPIKKCYFIIGADNLANLHKWDKFDELSRKVEFVVASRDGIEVPPSFKKLDIHSPISSSKLQERLDDKFIPQRILKSVKKFYQKRDED